MIDKSILMEHPKNVRDIVRFLDSSHLADTRLQFIVQKFEQLASDLLYELNTSADLVLTLRKIVDAKNLAVQAKILDIESQLDKVQTHASQ